MSDLVKRLRELADCDARYGAPLGKAMREAAARIEALEARIAKAEGALHYIGYKSRPIDFTAEQLRLHARMALAAYREGSDT